MFKKLKGTDPASKCHICSKALAPEDLAANVASYVHQGKCQEEEDAQNAFKKNAKETRSEKKEDRWGNKLVDISKRVRRDAPPEQLEVKADHSAWLGKEVEEPTHLTSLDFPALSSGKNKEKKEYGLGDLSRLLKQSIRHNAAVRGYLAITRPIALDSFCID